MDRLLEIALTEGVSLAILVLVLAGGYRIASRLMTLLEIGLERFLTDFEKMADGIAEIAKATADKMQ